MTAAVEAPHKLPDPHPRAASIGNAVEWYDYRLPTFSIYFATQIFPSENESLAFIGTSATYALAFFFLPLGGFLLGRYADLKGRKQAMLQTILLMAGGSLVIAILPTFATLGWPAPVRLLRPASPRACRLVAKCPTRRHTSPRIPQPEPPRPLLVVLLHLHWHLGTARRYSVLFSRARWPTHQLASWGWRSLSSIGAALAWSGCGYAHGRDRTFQKNVAKAEGIKIPLTDAREHRRRSPADRPHFAQHALLLHFLLGIDPVRSQAQRARRRHGVLGAVIAVALFVFFNTPSAGSPIGSAASRSCSYGRGDCALMVRSRR